MPPSLEKGITHVRFYAPGEIEESRLIFAVNVAQTEAGYLFCKHRDRDTWECPGGHIEAGETALQAAQRELWEETGAVDATVTPIAIYSVSHGDGVETFGLLCRAIVRTLAPLPEMSEIGEVRAFAALPDRLTYPDIQPLLWEHAAL